LIAQALPARRNGLPAWLGSELFSAEFRLLLRFLTQVTLTALPGRGI